MTRDEAQVERLRPQLSTRFSRQSNGHFPVVQG